MTMPLTHPSGSKLRAWLEDLVPSPAVTTHVESCERCASKLMELAEADVAPLADVAPVAEAVTAAWAPPSDLTERVIRRIDAAERNRRDLEVVLGLFSVATETASLMLPGDEQEPHAEEGTTS